MKSSEGFRKPILSESGEEESGFRNQDRARKVEKKEGKPKYYTVLNARYKVGDVITGVSTSPETKNPSVFLSTSEKPHYSLTDREDLKDATIYRVSPIGKVHPGYTWDELTASSVEVLEVIGSTKGFVEKDQYGHVDLGKDPLQRKRVEEGTAEEKKANGSRYEGAELLKKIEKKFKSI